MESTGAGDKQSVVIRVSGDVQIGLDGGRRIEFRVDSGIGGLVGNSQRVTQQSRPRQLIQIEMIATSTATNNPGTVIEQIIKALADQLDHLENGDDREADPEADIATKV